MRPSPSPVEESDLSSIILHPMLPLRGIRTNKKARVFSKKLEGIYDGLSHSTSQKSYETRANTYILWMRWDWGCVMTFPCFWAIWFFKEEIYTVKRERLFEPGFGLLSCISVPPPLCMVTKECAHKCNLHRSYYQKAAAEDNQRTTY